MVRVLPLFSVDESGKAKTSAEALQALCKIEGRVAVLAVCGLYRSGKSFLLNQLYNNLVQIGAEQRKAVVENKVGELKRDYADAAGGGFEVGNTINACTSGIWILEHPVKLKVRKKRKRKGKGKGQDEMEEVSVVLMDCEGFGSTDRNAAYDAKVFALATLLCSCLLFNAHGTVDERSIESLAFIANLTQQIKAESNGCGHAAHETDGKSTIAIEDTSGSLQAFFPNFIWCLRDFQLELTHPTYGDPITPTEYLELALEATDGYDAKTIERNRTRSMLREYFRNRHCFTLVRPVIEESLLQDLQAQQASALRPEFRKDLSRLCSALVNGPTESMPWEEETGDSEAAAATATAGFDSAGENGATIGDEPGGALLCAKRISGRVLSGSMLASMVQTYVTALFGDENGKAGVTVGAVSIADAWTSALREECTTGFKEAQEMLAELDVLALKKGDDELDLPFEQSSLTNLCRRTFVGAILHYRSRTGAEDLSRGAAAVAECSAEELGFELYSDETSSSSSSSTESRLQIKKESMTENDNIIFEWEVKLYKEAAAAFAKLRQRNTAASSSKCMSLLRHLMDMELARGEQRTDAECASTEKDEDPELKLAQKTCYGPLDIIGSFCSSLQKYGKEARGPWAAKMEVLAKFTRAEIFENLVNKSCSKAAEQVQSTIEAHKSTATQARVEADSTKESLSQALISVKTANERAQSARNEADASNTARATLQEELLKIQGQLKDAQEARAMAAKAAATKLEAVERSASADSEAAKTKINTLRTRIAELEGQMGAFRSQAEATNEQIQRQTDAIQTRSKEAAELSGKVRALQMQLEDSKAEIFAMEREYKARETASKLESKRIAAEHERKLSECSNAWRNERKQMQDKHEMQLRSTNEKLEAELKMAKDEAAAAEVELKKKMKNDLEQLSREEKAKREAAVRETALRIVKEKDEERKTAIQSAATRAASELSAAVAKVTKEADAKMRLEANNLKEEFEQSIQERADTQSVAEAKLRDEVVALEAKVALAENCVQKATSAAEQAERRHQEAATKLATALSRNKDLEEDLQEAAQSARQLRKQLNEQMLVGEGSIATSLSSPAPQSSADEQGASKDKSTSEKQLALEIAEAKTSIAELLGKLAATQAELEALRASKEMSLQAMSSEVEMSAGESTQYRIDAAEAKAELERLQLRHADLKDGTRESVAIVSRAHNLASALNRCMTGEPLIKCNKGSEEPGILSLFAAASGGAAADVAERWLCLSPDGSALAWGARLELAMKQCASLSSCIRLKKSEKEIESISSSISVASIRSVLYGHKSRTFLLKQSGRLDQAIFAPWCCFSIRTKNGAHGARGRTYDFVCRSAESAMAWVISLRFLVLVAAELSSSKSVERRGIVPVVLSTGLLACMPKAEAMDAAGAIAQALSQHGSSLIGKALWQRAALRLLRASAKKGKSRASLIAEALRKAAANTSK